MKNEKKIQPITILLDRSGSMDSIADATIAGINAFIADQAKDLIPSVATLIQFDSEDSCEIVFQDCPINQVRPLTKKRFVPRGMTPLYDAIARAICLTDTHKGRSHPIVVIVTDGMENASREVTGAFVSKLVSTKIEVGWRFVYLGANQDAVLEGARLGISEQNSITFTATDEKVEMIYAASSRIVREMKCGVDAHFSIEERAAQLPSLDDSD